MSICPDRSIKFGCTKCKFKTSGIILRDKHKTRRWCPSCTSPLFQCNHCYNFTSATIVGSDVICDSCKKVVKPETLIGQF